MIPRYTITMNHCDVDVCKSSDVTELEQLVTELEQLNAEMLEVLKTQNKMICKLCNHYNPQHKICKNAAVKININQS